ncbi:MAG: hypothetical protein KDA60_10715 [Planctomycetales bacterium]|nr:hypothetical protein [Planctomycetales bacterium]
MLRTASFILILSICASAVPPGNASDDVVATAPFDASTGADALPAAPATPGDAITPAIEVELPNPDTGLTMDDVREEIGKLSWKKNGLSITPYGILWTDAIFATSRTFPGNFILYVESDETHGEKTYEIDSRRSRVGVDIAAPEVDLFGGVTSGGKVEIDFLGGFVNPNTTDLRLRHVYWEAKNEHLRFLVGQTWDVVSPLIPSTVNFSVNWGAGNIGFRRAQIRYERYVPLSSDVTMELQSALAQNIVPDLASGDVAAGVIRESGAWPMLQGRLGFKVDAIELPLAFGVSGHIGETGFDFTRTGPGPAMLPPERNARFQSWSANADWSLPMSERFGIHGEFFTGENLSNLLGGINQGVCPCLRVPISSIGGWTEIWFDWTQHIHSHLGFGVDDPDDSDSVVGRTQNRVIYANVMIDLTKRLRTGLEVASWETRYHNLTLTEPDPANRIAGPTAPGEAVVIDWMMQYRF